MRPSAVCLASVTITAMAVATATTRASTAPFTSPPVTPITVRIGKPVRECNPNGKDCNPWLYRTVTVSFVARENLAAGARWYELNLRFTPTGACPVEQGGMGGPASPFHLRAGQRATWASDIIDCPRVVHGAIAYDTNTAPHTNRDVPSVGYIDGVLVGTFGFTMK